MQKGGKWGIVGSPQAVNHPCAVAALHVLIKIYLPSGIFLLDNLSFNKAVRDIVGDKIPLQRLHYSPPDWAGTMSLSRLKYMIRVMQAYWLHKVADCVIVIQSKDTPPSFQTLVDELRRVGAEIREIDIDLVKS